MSDVRLAGPKDAASVHALVDAVDKMPTTARYAAHMAIETALRRGGATCLVLEERGALRGLAVARPVALAKSALELEWLVVAAGDRDPRRVVAGLVEALLDQPGEGRSVLRFGAGRWQRGGLDAHVLDGAGLVRAGAIEGFFGPGDDLVLFTARGRDAQREAFRPDDPAALYDAAFAYRDFVHERDFLLAVAAAHGTRAVRRVGSWACGAGRHLRAFAELGVVGVGVDDAPDLLALAEASYRGVSDDPAETTWVLSSLDQRVEAPSVDLSFCMLSGVHRLGGEPAIARHLAAVADLLAPGGVHVVEATLPVDATPDGNTETRWTERRPGFLVRSHFRLAADLRAGDGTVPALLDVRCTRESGEVVGVLQQQERWLVPDEAGWRELVRTEPRLEVVTLLGDFQLGVRWDQAGAWRILLVLRRREVT